MDKTPVEYLQSKFSEIGYQECRTLLGRFGLEGHAHTIASSELSGGQKARVVFASLCLEAPHVMVLDEPSNNLDAESIDALADAITKFQGGIVLVSHDARLIRNTDCQLWVCDKQNVKPFEGTLDDYKRSLLESIHEEEDKLDVIMEKRRKEEEDARLALLREMKQKQLARKSGTA
jgi:ATP-binding cassette subfamily F protein 1